ncbi:DUF2877 domain-containing protein [Microbacterium sp. B2969]|uniref:DUF2877 domain-containing protein n=1 Tax=Microbacterium alkaliflavum TaxID=3248839 RepID=A0ABW7Q6Z5_9MICO
MTTTAPPRALSLDLALSDRLRAGVVRGRVHSTFARVVNLEADDGTLVSLSARTVDDGPWAIRADVAGWAPERWTPGRRVEIGRDVVRLETDPHPALVVTDAGIWAPRIAPLPDDPAGLVPGMDVLAAIAERASTPADAFSAAVAARLRDGVGAIVRGELAGDAQTLGSGIRALLGLGPGLTPSGDDVLAGLALVATRPGSRVAVYLPALERALERRGATTTLVSRAMLRAALAGRARHSVMRLLLRLSAPADGAALHDAARAVAAIGHTSGIDLITGILAGLRLETELRGTA